MLQESLGSLLDAVVYKLPQQVGVSVLLRVHFLWMYQPEGREKVV